PGLPDLLGRVDLIIETDAELVISDWKTSRSRWNTEQAEDAAEQLLLYAELAQDFATGKSVHLELRCSRKRRKLPLTNSCRPWNRFESIAPSMLSSEYGGQLRLVTSTPHPRP